MRASRIERERCDAGEKARRHIPVSSDPLRPRPMLVTKVGWAAVGAVNARARERERDEKRG